MILVVSDAVLSRRLDQRIAKIPQLIGRQDQFVSAPHLWFGKAVAQHHDIASDQPSRMETQGFTGSDDDAVEEPGIVLKVIAQPLQRSVAVGLGQNIFHQMRRLPGPCS
ncbi:MAG: hypothetical protein ACWA44_00340 [Thiotrichales bacterium]